MHEREAIWLFCRYVHVGTVHLSSTACKVLGFIQCPRNLCPSQRVAAFWKIHADSAWCGWAQNQACKRENSPGRIKSPQIGFSSIKNSHSAEAEPHLSAGCQKGYARLVRPTNSKSTRSPYAAFFPFLLISPSLVDSGVEKYLYERRDSSSCAWFCLIMKTSFF